MADETRKKVVIEFDADKKQIDEVDKQLHDIGAKPIPLDIDAESVLNTLSVLKNAAIKFQDALKGAGKGANFKALNEDLESVRKKIDSVYGTVRTKHSGQLVSESFLNVRLVDVFSDSVNEAIAAIKELNSTFQGEGELSLVLKQAETSLKSINNTLLSISSTLSTQVLRPVATIKKEIETVTAELQRAESASVKANENAARNLNRQKDNFVDIIETELEFQKGLSSINAADLIKQGDISARSLNAILQNMKDYTVAGGSLSDIRFENIDGGTVYNAHQVLDILKKIDGLKSKIDPNDIIDNALGRQATIVNAKEQLAQLTSELESATAKELSGVRVTGDLGFDTAAIEKLASVFQQSINSLSDTLTQTGLKLQNNLSAGFEETAALSSESSEVQNLKKQVDHVTESVRKKTAAFENEAQTVIPLLEKEQAALNQLPETLNTNSAPPISAQDIEALSNESTAVTNLKKQVDDVTESVQKKTSAFESEANTVIPLLDKEQAALKQLSKLEAEYEQTQKNILAKEEIQQKNSRRENTPSAAPSHPSSAGTGKIAANPNDLKLLRDEMEALALSQDGVINGTISFNEKTRQLSFDVKNANGDLEKYVLTLDKATNEIQRYNTKTVKAKSPVITADVKARSFTGDPNDLKELKQAMRSLALEQKGVIANTISFNEQTRKMSFQTKDAVGNINKYSISLDKASNELHTFLNKTVESKTVFEELDSFLTTGGKKVVSYIGSFGSVYEVWDILRQGLGIIADLDKSFTEMRKVSDEPVRSLREYGQEAFDIADQTGSTASIIQNSTADWMRLGESLEEAKESAKNTSILMNVSEFEDINEATDSLVAMSQAYQELEQMDIIDKLNLAGNNFSISTSDLAQSLQRSAASLKVAGNDINEAIALTVAGDTYDCQEFVETHFHRIHLIALSV